jgi:hypothetical protein
VKKSHKGSLIEMFKSIKFLFTMVAAFGLCSFSSNAHALSLNANTQYNLNGHALAVFDVQNVGTYYLQFTQTGLVDTGNLSGGSFDSVNVQSLINSTHAFIWNTGTNNWDALATPTLNGYSNATYNNVSTTGALSAAVEGTTTGSGSISVAGNLHHLNIVTGGANDLMLGFMDFTAPNPLPRWDVFDGAFANNSLGLMVLPTGDGVSAYLDAWFKGNGQLILDNQTHNVLFHVDYHSTLTEIPEPATMGLLFSGLLGGVAARRRQKQAIKA